MKKNAYYTICIISAAFFWGIIGVFSRHLAAGGLEAAQITALRCFTSALLLTLALAAGNPSLLRIDLKDMWMFIGTGLISIVLFNVCYFLTLGMTTMAVAATLLYTAPFFVMLISAAVFREALTAKKLASLAIAFAGCLLITGVLGSGAEVPTLAVLTGVGSGLGYGLYSIFAKKALEKYHPLTVTVWTFIVAFACILPFCGPMKTAKLLAAKPSLALWVLLLGAVSTLLPFLLYTKGLEGTPLGRASVLAFVEPAVATIVGVLLFRESMSLAQGAGLVLVFAAIVLMNLKPIKKRVASNRG